VKSIAASSSIKKTAIDRAQHAPTATTSKPSRRHVVVPRFIDVKKRDASFAAMALTGLVIFLTGLSPAHAYLCEAIFGTRFSPEFVILPSGKRAPPTSFSGGFHGNTVPPDFVMIHGLPGQGRNLRLLEHADSDISDAAFRGTTSMVADPVTQSGAAYWAGEGGWVYEIRHVPTWDVNLLLAGRVKRNGKYIGNHWIGENEQAVSAYIPPQKIARYGRVVMSASGILYVRTWIPNPAFEGQSD
jgi:hypothetical protein